MSDGESVRHSGEWRQENSADERDCETFERFRACARGSRHNSSVVCVLLSVCGASGFDFLWGDVVSEEGSRSYGEALCDA